MLRFTTKMKTAFRHKSQQKQKKIISSIFFPIKSAMYGLVRSSLLCLFTTLHTTSEVNGKIARCVQVETSYSVNTNY